MLNQEVLRLGDVRPGARRGRPVLLPPKVAGGREVLAGAMLDDVTTHRRKHLPDLVVSLALHLAVLIVLLVIPLFFTVGLDLHRSVTTFLVAPLPPNAVPPPPPSAVARVPRTPLKQILKAGQLTAPTFVPKQIVSVVNDAPPPDQQLVAGLVGGLPGETAGGQVGGFLGVGITGAPVPPKGISEPKRPIRLGSGLKPPQLIFSPAPEYPLLAKQAHIAGTVVIEAIIDERGNVKEARAISGQPLLVPAALKAVSLRRYEPTILDSEPTPIELTVEVSFHG
jgi:periplasmic protein TonB